VSDSRPVAVLAMHPVLTRGMFSAAHHERLASLCDVPDPAPLEDFDDERAAALLPTAEILLTGWGSRPIGAEVLSRAPALRAVVHSAGTVKHFVEPAVFERGIRVVSAAAANALPVAEYTLATILLANKRIFRAQRMYAEVRNYRLWPKEFPGLGNLGKVIGVVGASRVGRALLEMLKPFDFDVLLCDPFLKPGEAESVGAERTELNELLERSDLVTLHAPSLPETRHMIDAAALARMRDGTVLVNTARGALVDGEALEAELVSGRLDAVIDTTDPEILPPDSPLYELPNVFLTPHVAGALGDETQRMADLALDEIERLVRGEYLRHEVRLEDLERIA
jgi:phosphoglycerate dehydrogenase-like enzyme